MKGVSALAPVALAALAFALSSCQRTKPDLLRGSDDKFTLGNAENGAKLVAHFECVRCHEGEALEAIGARVKPEKACVGCHEAIVDGRFAATPASLAKWQPLVKDLRHAPTLSDVSRLRTPWLVSYLQRPHDLRPGLRMTMPRLAITDSDARDIAAHLKSAGPFRRAVNAALGNADIAKGDAKRGENVLAAKGCMVCHRMTGGPAIGTSPIPVTMTPAKLERAMALAPDLRHARDRFEPSMLAAWVRKPSDLKPTSDMPDIPMTEDEARDVATFLLTAPLTEAPRAKSLAVASARLPVLSRPVTFEEVNAKIFHRTCWHCHSEPDFAIGDGGPGNSGGFGFTPRGVDLSSFPGVMAGFLERTPVVPLPVVDASVAAITAPRRKSLFAAASASDPTPRLLAALIARHTEEGAVGVATGEVRGMPLGLPPLPAEDIQLVETWIAQGRPK